ncbi:MAG TPA: hypothetical protein VFK13_11195 [Gemmatimonadaceae bacterium]|nr:hypothetical protein [Gemmatimonadaceae bacterium]
MSMKEIATIRFEDADTGDPGVAVIRTAARVVGLALSLESNGDIEVFLKAADCERVIAALQQALGK